MKTARERVIEWLRDIHAAEEQAHTLLQKTASQLDGHAEFRAGLDRHGELSKQQAARLKDCLDDLGEGTSALKIATGQASALMQTLSGYVVGDEPVKALLAISSFTQMEASSYRILSAGAQVAGLDRAASLCRSHLAEEENFAQWLESQTEPLTQEFLAVEKAEA